MNKDKVTSLCHKVSAETGLSFNAVMTHYFLETILQRLASSPYIDHFVFKGGFLLSNILGLQTRSTLDLDFLLVDISLNERSISDMLTKSLEASAEGDIIYQIQAVTPIRKEKPYGGFRVKILCRLQNIRLIVPLDIAAGDTITPGPIIYNYESFFGLNDIRLNAYPLETILAEKLHAIYSLGFLNSRIKDYYDVYIIFCLRKREIDKGSLKQACVRTFLNRNTEFSTDKIRMLLSEIKKDEPSAVRWGAYSRKHAYAGAIEFVSIIAAIGNLLELIESADPDP